MIKIRVLSAAACMFMACASNSSGNAQKTPTGDGVVSGSNQSNQLDNYMPVGCTAGDGSGYARMNVSGQIEKTVNFSGLDARCEGTGIPGDYTNVVVSKYTDTEDFVVSLNFISFPELGQTKSDIKGSANVHQKTESLNGTWETSDEGCSFTVTRLGKLAQKAKGMDSLLDERLQITGTCEALKPSRFLGPDDKTPIEVKDIDIILGFVVFQVID